ncbi:MAG: DUF2344 domain-containing protein [Anaerolineae bacterium]|nr:DUF2344 domain-containing protein [Anaerolineae bacterium]
MAENEMIRLRITFSKQGALRFIGHLDLAKTWERVLRRAGMPLVYSQGFNPQPRMQIASALPLGVSSDCEMLDIWLAAAVPLADLPERLNAVSPVGLVTSAAEPVELKAPALQAVLASADYLITIDEVDDGELRRRIEALLAANHLERDRRGKTYDLRPRILELAPQGAGTVRARLSLGQQGTARPDEVIATLELSPNQARIHRLAINLTDDAAEA